MEEEEKINFLMRVIEADKGAEGEDMDFKDVQPRRSGRALS